MASTSIVKLVSLSTWRIMHTNVRSLRFKFPSLLLHKGYDMWSYLFFSLMRSCWRNNLWPCRLFYGGKHYLNFSMIVDEKYWGGGSCFDRYIGSKQCKDHYLDQQFCWAFHRYAVGEVWDNKWGLWSSAKVIHTIKFCKTVSRVWVFKSLILLWQIFRINWLLQNQQN